MSLKSPKILNLKNLATSIMENMELWHFQTFLDLIIKYFRPPLWLTHPNDEEKNQSVFLDGLAYKYLSELQQSRIITKALCPRSAWQPFSVIC